MRFNEIIAHKDVTEALRRMVDNDNIPHAVMIAGPQGIGKTRLARAFAQYIHCESRSGGDSCGRCPSCVQHQKLSNPDMHYVFPVVRKKTEKLTVSSDYARLWSEMLRRDSYMDPRLWLEVIKAGNSQPLIAVSESEAIIGSASISPFRQKKKIYLIWQPEKMTAEAANKLLKLIEEPYEDTAFILVSNAPENVLPTITSRTRRFNLRPLANVETIEAMISLGVDPAVASVTGPLAEGSVSRAMNLAADNGESEEFGEYFRQIMRSAYARKIATLKSLSDRIAEFGREKQRRFCDYCLRMVRENFIYNLKMPQINLMTPSEEAFSQRFSPYIHHSNVEEMAREFSRAAYDIERNANPKIVFFDLFMQLCRLIRTVKAV